MEIIHFHNVWRMAPPSKLTVNSTSIDVPQVANPHSSSIRTEVELNQLPELMLEAAPLLLPADPKLVPVARLIHVAIANYAMHVENHPTCKLYRKS